MIVLDVPLDPFGGSLFLEKTTQSPIAAPGDFIEYTLTLSNATGAGAANGVMLDDLLPPGFRYVEGSSRLDSGNVADPSMGSDGRSLQYSVGDVAAGTSLRLRYVALVGPGAQTGEAVNTAVARVGTGTESNTARAVVQIVEDLFRDKSFLVGRLVLGSCDEDVANDLEGVSGVRIYLEDGRYSLTDENGRYHFEGLEPGVHVVQVDLDSMPQRYELVACEDNSRFSGREYSRFVDLRGGTLWRADFYARPVQAPSGHVDVALQQNVNGEELDYRVSLNGAGLPVEDLTAMVMLPNGVRPIPGSVRIEGRPADDPRRHGNVVTFTLGSRAGTWHSEVKFRAGLQPTAGGDLVTRAVGRFKVAGESEQTPTAETKAFRRAGTTVMERYVLSLRPQRCGAHRRSQP